MSACGYCITQIHEHCLEEFTDSVGGVHSCTCSCTTEEK